MTEHRINMSAAEIRAYQAGERVIRRKVKPSRTWGAHSHLKVGMPWAAESFQVWWHYPETDRVGHLQDSPFGQPGDRVEVSQRTTLENGSRVLVWRFDVTVRTVRVDLLDGVWWWVAEVHDA